MDTTTGEILSTYTSAADPLGVTYVRCGNRRASKCPACSRLYAGDTFQLIRAGVAGGKTVPVSVADNPLVFATFTAPSFGKVHGRRDQLGRCHPHTRGPATWRSKGTGGPPGRRIGKRLRYRPQDVRDWVASLPTGVAS